MKKALAIVAMVVVLPLGCGSSDDDSTAGSGAAAASGATAVSGSTAASGAGGMTAGSGGAVTAAAGATAGASAAAGASGGTSDKCPGGVAAEDYVTVTTAAELAALASCTTFKNLSVSGAAITSLGALSKVTTITANLSITDTKVTDLQGLNALTSVGGAMYIGLGLGMEKTMSSALTSLKGLENLKTIGGQLQINENALLTDISALKSLTSIGTGKLLQFRNNSSVPTCDAQALVTQIKRALDDGNTEICGTKKDTCGEPVACQSVT